MDWKNHKLIGLSGIAVVLVCLSFAISFFISRIQENLRWQKKQRQIQQTEEYKQWREYEERGGAK